MELLDVPGIERAGCLVGALGKGDWPKFSWIDRDETNGLSEIRLGHARPGTFRNDVSPLKVHKPSGSLMALAEMAACMRHVPSCGGKAAHSCLEQFRADIVVLPFFSHRNMSVAR